MNDIVERLLIWNPPEVEAKTRLLDAAEEIKRLRDAAVIARTTEANLHSEIERLRGLLREVAEEMTGDCCLTDEAIADGLIERVREALGDG